MKRGQAWGFDLIIASTLFIFGILAFFLYSLNSPEITNTKMEEMTYEGGLIADDLMSFGTPEDWTNLNVLKIGIHSDNKINQTKLEQFHFLASTNYSYTRKLFDTKYHYFFNLSETIIVNGNPIEGIGTLSQNPSNLIKITRFTIYQNKPVTLNLYIWEE